MSRNTRGLTYDEAKAEAKASIHRCPSLVIEDERRDDGHLGWHPCACPSNLNYQPFCGWHRTERRRTS